MHVCSCVLLIAQVETQLVANCTVWSDMFTSLSLGEAEGDQVDRRRPRGPRRGGFGYRGGYRPRGPPRRRNEGEVG